MCLLIEDYNVRYIIRGDDNMSLSEALRAIIADPEDLTQLPAIIEQVAQLEASELQYQERISKLQNLNKEFLAQIPIAGEDTKSDDQQDEEPTLEDAKAYLVETLGGE